MKKKTFPQGHIIVVYPRDMTYFISSKEFVSFVTVSFERFTGKMGSLIPINLISCNRTARTHTIIYPSGRPL